jgi:hypothetical protein
MWRPVAYFYQTARTTTEEVPAYPPLPAGTGKVTTMSMRWETLSSGG